MLKCLLLFIELSFKVNNEQNSKPKTQNQKTWYLITLHQLYRVDTCYEKLSRFDKYTRTDRTILHRTRRVEYYTQILPLKSDLSFSFRTRLCWIWSFKGQWQRKQLRPPCQAKKVKKVPKANTFYAALVRLQFSFTSTLTRRCTHSSSLVLWLVQSILLRRSPLFAEEKTTGTSAPQQGFCCRAGFVVLAQTQIFTRFSLLCVSSRVFPAGSPQG